MGAGIRIVFSISALIMLLLFGYGVAAGTWSIVNWGMLAVALVCCLLIFVRFVYVFNFSYALCAVFNGALIWVTQPSAAAALIGGIAILYGLRLLVFSWLRTRSESYAERVNNTNQADADMPLPAKVMLYVMVTWLMTFHLMAAWFVASAEVLSPGVIAGCAIMLSGTVIEGVADWQKQQVKKQNRDAYIITGLFSRWRHPNYLGEIGLHAGLMIAGLSVVESMVGALMVVVGPLYIMLLMISEARRVDAYQATRYGSDPVWQQYRERSGSLLPW